MSTKRKNMTVPGGSEKKQRKVIDFEMKMKIIKDYEAGKKVKFISSEFGLSHSTVSTILKDKEKVKAAVKASTGFKAIITRQRKGLIHEMEKLLAVWFDDQTQKKIPLSILIIQTKARSIFNTLKEREGSTEMFTASNGWFQRFRRRFNLHNRCASGEAASADVEAAEKFVNEMPEHAVKSEADQLPVQIVKSQHPMYKEAMEVQSAVAAATANIISQPPIESYDPGPEQSLQNSKMRGCTDKDLSVSFSASSRPATVFKKTYVDPEHADGMMKSLASLWRKRRLCDAKICSGDKNVTLHRLVLFAASPHLMEKNITDGADLEVNLPPGISEDGLKIFVSFLYDGVLNLNEHLYKDVERISNLLKVDKIQKHCREFSASLNEHRQMTSSPSISAPRRRDNLPKSQKSSNRQTVVLTLSDDSNPPETSVGQQHPQEHTLTLSHSQIEDLQNNLDERIQALNEHHAYMTSHHDRYPPATQTSGISLQTAANSSTISHESGIKTEPIEILDDDITDYSPSQDNIKHSKRSLNSSKSYAGDGPGSDAIRRSSQPHTTSSTVTRTYLTTSKCESGLEMAEMDGITTSCASGTSPYPVSLVASSGETFPLYTLSSNQS